MNKWSIVIVSMISISTLHPESVLQKVSAFVQEHMKKKMKNKEVRKTGTHAKILGAVVAGIAFTGGLSWRYFMSNTSTADTAHSKNTPQVPISPQKTTLANLQDRIKADSDVIKIPNEKRITQEKDVINDLKNALKSEYIEIEIDQITEQLATLSIYIKDTPLVSSEIESQQLAIACIIHRYCPDIKTMQIKIGEKVYYTWDYQEVSVDEEKEKIV